ncbi:MAG: DUF3179 domain-containing protein [Pseudomonadota bacterium]
MKSIITALGTMLIVAAAFAEDEPGADRRARVWDLKILEETFGYGPDTPAAVPWEDLIQGCPKRDCIPAIDAPTFVDAAGVDYLLDDDLVMGVDLHGTARAYPIRILLHHEVVNDRIGATAFAITYCPLCGSGVAFDRSIDGKETTFGVSGVLHDSDLVLYDRASETLWQQITAEAIMGPHLGATLATIPMSMTTWAEWRGAHPDSEVLSLATGHDYDYRGRNRFAEYDESDRIVFPVGHIDRRIHPKTYVYGAEIGAVSAAVIAGTLDEDRSVAVTIAGRGAEFVMAPGGLVELRFIGTGEVHTAHRVFWFAWANFHPDTALVGQRERSVGD